MITARALFDFVISEQVVHCEYLNKDYIFDECMDAKRQLE